MGRSTDRITTLDGFRALAIISVLAFHYTVAWAPPRNPNSLLPAGAIFDGFVPLEYGWLGVEFFFVISGFVILMTLERCRNVGDFIVRRFARLWPPLIVAATLTTVVMIVLGPPEWQVSKSDFVTSILLIEPSLTAKLVHNQTIKWVDGAYWSLWVEIRFYALAAIVYLLSRKNFVKYWLVFQVLVYITALLVQNEPNQVLTVKGLLWWVCFPAFISYFTLGVCLYEIYSKGSLQMLAVAGAIMASFMILCSAFFGLDPYAGKSALVCVPANLIILTLFFLFVVDHPILSVFRHRSMVVLGQASYSLYLIHQQIGIAVMRRCVDWGVPYLIVLPMMIAAIIAAAFLLYRYVELPAKLLVLGYSQGVIGRIERYMPWLSFNSPYA